MTLRGRAFSIVVFWSIAALCGWLALAGPPERSLDLRPDLREELVGSAGDAVSAAQPRAAGDKASDAESAKARDGSRRPYERVLRVARDARFDDVVPDSSAATTWVVPAEDLRVLDPRAVSLHRLGLVRRSRPLRLLLRIAGRMPGDRVELSVGGRKLADRADVDLGDWEREIDIERVTGDVEVVVDWSGERVTRAAVPSVAASSVDSAEGDGGDASPLSAALAAAGQARLVRRRGRVVVRWRIKAGPAPRVFVGESIAADAPSARALRLQGFEIAKDLAKAELLLARLGSGLPPELATHVDRGAGLLLLGDNTSRIDPSLVELAPVLAAEAAAPPEDARDKSKNKPPKEIGPPQPERGGDETAAKPKAGDLRRPEAPKPKELERAGNKTELRETRAVALVLLVDVSQSMAAPVRTPRIEVAKRAAAATAATLAKDDDFALVTFGRRSRVILPLGPAERRVRLEQELKRLRAEADTTHAYPGLGLAWDLLKRSDAPVRHVVILTDGEFLDHFRPYEERLAAMKRDGIGVSALGMRDRDVPRGEFAFLGRLLASVEGRLLTTSSPTEVPRLLLGEVKEVVEAARPSRIDKPRGVPKAKGSEHGPPPPERKNDPSTKRKDPPPPGDAPKAKPSFGLVVIDAKPWLRDLEKVEWPAVRGYVPLDAKPRARVALAIKDHGHAVLASSAYGLGRVAVLACGDESAWAAELFEAPWYPQLVGQVAEWLLPGETTPRSRLEPLDRRILEGDGPTLELLAEVAERSGGQVADRLALPEEVEARRRVQVALPVLGLLAALIAALCGGALRRRVGIA